MEKALARSASVSAYTAQALVSVTVELQEGLRGLTYTPDTVELLRDVKRQIAELIQAIEEAADAG